MARLRSRLSGPARVLVVADEPIASFIGLALNHGIYTVEKTATVDDAEAKRATWRPHLLVLDIDLLDGDAGALIGVVVRGGRVPTIVLTERGDLKTKLRAFDAGADDVVTVPISPEELVARSLALMRRTYGDSVPFVPVIRVGG